MILILILFVITSTKAQKKVNIPIRAFDKIYFGKTSPELESIQDYEGYLDKYSTELVGIKFYYMHQLSGWENHFGLFQFALGCWDEYTEINEVQDVILKLKEIIESKYGVAKVVNFSDKEQKSHMDDIFHPSSEIYNYQTYKYRWEHKGIVIYIEYETEINWVDSVGKKFAANQIKYKTYKKNFYRPIITFIYKEEYNKFWKTSNDLLDDVHKKSTIEDKNKF